MERSANDLVGRKFGLLTAECLSGKRVTRGEDRRRAEAIWRCQCVCGEVVEVRRRLLIEGKKRYCSIDRHKDDHKTALRAAVERRRQGEVSSSANVVRGPRALVPAQWADHAKAWKVWRGIRARCVYESGLYYKKGIRMCEEWQRSFPTFFAEIGDPPTDKHSVDRINTFGHYEPGNVRWATRAEQGANRRKHVWVEWKGERRKLVDVCVETGAIRWTVYQRLKMGWDLEKALA